MVLYEMSNISCSFIGYDNVYIWIGINPKNHGRRIKISNKFNKFDRNDNFVLTIPDFKITVYKDTINIKRI